MSHRQVIASAALIVCVFAAFAQFEARSQPARVFSATDGWIIASIAVTSFIFDRPILPGQWMEYCDRSDPKRNFYLEREPPKTDLGTPMAPQGVAELRSHDYWPYRCLPVRTKREHDDLKSFKFQSIAFSTGLCAEGVAFVRRFLSHHGIVEAFDRQNQKISFYKERYISIFSEPPFNSRQMQAWADVMTAECQSDGRIEFTLAFPK